MRLAHVSDFHYTTLSWNPLHLFSKRCFGFFNWIFRRDKEFSPTQVEPLIELFSDLKVDLILLGGDFTTTSMLEEFESASLFVSQLKAPWIAVPGNHDHYTYKSYREKLYYRYFSNSSPDLFSLAEHGVEGHKIAVNWWVVSLDTARPTGLTSSQGLLSEKSEKHLEELLKTIPKQDFIILFNHYPFLQNDESRKGLERAEVLEQLIRRHPQIRLYLHGHTHRHTVADLQKSGLPIILDSGSCAQGPQGSWNLIDIDKKGCIVTSYRWNNHWYPSKTEEFVWQR